VAHVAEEVLLAPASEHVAGDQGGRHGWAEAGQDGELEAVGPGHHDPPPGSGAVEGDGVLDDPEPDATATKAGAAAHEAFPGQVGLADLVGDEVDALAGQPLEQLAVVAAPVEDEGEAAIAVTECALDLGHDAGHGLGQAATGLLGDEEQRPSPLVAHEVGDEAGQRHPALRVPNLAELALAGVDLGVAVNVEVGGGDHGLLDPAPGELAAELQRLALLEESVVCVLTPPNVFIQRGGQHILG